MVSKVLAYFPSPERTAPCVYVSNIDRSCKARGGTDQNSGRRSTSPASCPSLVLNPHPSRRQKNIRLESQNHTHHQRGPIILIQRPRKHARQPRIARVCCLRIERVRVIVGHDRLRGRLVQEGRVGAIVPGLVAGVSGVQCGEGREDSSGEGMKGRVGKRAEKEDIDEP